MTKFFTGFQSTCLRHDL